YAVFEVWHNLNGFVDVRIHTLWFLVAMSCARVGVSPLARQTSTACNGIIFRFLELVVVLVYVQSGVAKLMRTGLVWATSGMTLQIGLVRQGIISGMLLAESDTLMVLLSCATLALELGFALYYPVRALRGPLLVISLAFHLGTFVTMGIDFSHLWI